MRHPNSKARVAAALAGPISTNLIVPTTSPTITKSMIAPIYVRTPVTAPAPILVAKPPPAPTATKPIISMTEIKPPLVLQPLMPTPVTIITAVPEGVPSAPVTVVKVALPGPAIFMPADAARQPVPVLPPSVSRPASAAIMVTAPALPGAEEPPITPPTPSALPEPSKPRRKLWAALLTILSPPVPFLARKRR